MISNPYAKHLAASSFDFDTKIIKAYEGSLLTTSEYYVLGEHLVIKI